MIERERLAEILEFGRPSKEERAELCRVYLKVLDAPEVTLGYHPDGSGRPQIISSGALGKRVRVVEVGDE